MCPTWCVLTTLYQAKLSSLEGKRSTTGGRKIVVPSVVAISESVQPIFFSTSCCVDDSSMSSPASAAVDPYHVLDATQLHAGGQGVEHFKRPTGNATEVRKACLRPFLQDPHALRVPGLELREADPAQDRGGML